MSMNKQKAAEKLRQLSEDDLRWLWREINALLPPRETIKATLGDRDGDVCWKHHGATEFDYDPGDDY